MESIHPLERAEIKPFSNSEGFPIRGTERNVAALSQVQLDQTGKR